MIASQVSGPAYAQEAPSQPAPAQGQTQAPPAAQAQPLPVKPTPAQNRQLSLAPDYSNGASFFPHFTLPYRPLQVPEPMLTNSPRIDQLIQSGKLMLSLEDAISLGPGKQHGHRRAALYALARRSSSAPRALGRERPTGVRSGSHRHAATSRSHPRPVNNPFLAGIEHVGHHRTSGSSQPDQPQWRGKLHLHAGFCARHAAAGQLSTTPAHPSIFRAICSILTRIFADRSNDAASSERLRQIAEHALHPRSARTP